MGILEFFLICLIVVVLAAFTVWAIGSFAPGTPAIVVKLIWAVAVLIIIVTLLNATGILGHDPQIPRLR